MASSSGKNRSGARRRSRADRNKKKSRFLEGKRTIDPQDVEFLRHFLTEHGKILPSRMTGTTARQQRLIRRGIARARILGFLP